MLSSLAQFLSVRKTIPITVEHLVFLLIASQGCIVFHFGTKLVDEKTVTAGGRVFTVVGLVISLPEAVRNAYKG